MTPQGARSGSSEAWLPNPSNVTYFNRNCRVRGLGKTSWYVNNPRINTPATFTTNLISDFFLEMCIGNPHQRREMSSAARGKVKQACWVSINFMSIWLALHGCGSICSCDICYNMSIHIVNVYMMFGVIEMGTLTTNVNAAVSLEWRATIAVWRWNKQTDQAIILPIRRSGQTKKKENENWMHILWEIPCKLQQIRPVIQ